MNDIQPMFPLLLAVLVCLAILALVVGMRRALRNGGRLRLSEALHGQGIPLPGVHSDAAVRALGIATRRCVTCAEHARCDELLAARAWKTLPEICPNTSYIDGLRAISPAGHRAADESGSGHRSR